MTRRRPLWIALGLAAALAAGLVAGHETAVRPPSLAPHEAAIDEAARESGLDPDLLRGLVAAESGGHARARSSAGALGLTQVLPATAREEAERRGLPPFEDEALLADTRLNLRLGAGYLARLLQRFGGEPAFALAAYNAGATHVQRWREKAPDASPEDVIGREGFPATRAYVRRVLELREAYRRAR